MTDPRDAVVEAIRKWCARHARCARASLTDELCAVIDALAALDETPEARVVRCARVFAGFFGGGYDHGNADRARASTALADALADCPEKS